MKKGSIFSLLICSFIILISPALSHANMLYVDKNSPSLSPDGQSWDTSFKTIKAAINTANIGDDIWVAKGRYIECLKVKPGLSLFGGFAGNETLKDQRNFAVNETIIDGDYSDCVLTVINKNAENIRIDGFTIQNGIGLKSTAKTRQGGGIYCDGTNVVIANNKITGNNPGTGPIKTDFGQGGGIYCSDTSLNVTIQNNWIFGNSASEGGGVASFSNVLICNNIFASNIATYGGGSIYAQNSRAITNNSIIGSNAGTRGGGICFSYTKTISNNIITLCSSGISYIGPTLESQPLTNNNVFNNYQYNYMNINPGSEDISVDPLFIGLGNGDYHLASTSPCIDSGNNDSVEQGWVDIDRESRVVHNLVDIGADEIADITAPTVWALPPGGMYDSAQSVELRVSEPANMYYSVDGSVPSISSLRYVRGQPIYVAQSTTIRFVAIDNADNQSQVCQEDYLIDTCKPETTIELIGDKGENNYYVSDVVTILLAADTGGAGLADIFYRIDNGTWQRVENSLTTSFKLTEEGIHIIDYYSKDKAGNAEDIETETVSIDKIAPTVAATPTGGVYGQAQQVVLTASEPAAIYFTINGSAPTVLSQRYIGDPISVISNMTLKFMAIDMAGNYSIPQPCNEETYIIDIPVENTMVFQPNDREGVDAQMSGKTLRVNTNYGTSEGMAIGHTTNKVFSPCYGIIQFDLSALPNEVSIVSAKLQLYEFAETSSGKTLNVGVFRVVKDWAEGSGSGEISNDGVTWNSRSYELDWGQPGGDYYPNPEAITRVSSINSWYTWDVTKLVQNWNRKTYLNYGLLVRDVDPEDITSNAYIKNFYTSDTINLTYRPKLVITYLPAKAFRIWQMDGLEGKDTLIAGKVIRENANYGKSTSFAIGHTTNAIFSPGYGLIEFNSALFPGNRVITKAELRLFNYTSSDSGRNMHIAAHKLTRNWTEGTGIGTETNDGATWKKYDGSNSWINAGGEFDANFSSITYIDSNFSWFSWDITSLIRSWQSDPLSNYGILLRDKNPEDTNAAAYIKNFYTSDHVDPSLRPQLLITYGDVK